MYFKEWERNPPVEVLAAAFAQAYLGWKPPTVTERGSADSKLPSYQEVMDEFNRRIEFTNRPRQLEKPAGPSVSEIFAEFDRRTTGNG